MSELKSEKQELVLFIRTLPKERHDICKYVGKFGDKWKNLKSWYSEQVTCPPKYLNWLLCAFPLINGREPSHTQIADEEPINYSLHGKILYVRIAEVCCVCMDNFVDVMGPHCCHPAVLCYECGSKLDRCPTCRATFASKFFANLIPVSRYT